jgi:antitoxin component YwqK of YwqJK toxin-antitoxin module
MRFNCISILTVLLLVFVSSGLDIKAQITIHEDGLYYDEYERWYTGVYVEKYPDGVVKAQISIKKGKKDGLMKLFYPDGSINELRMYKNNLMHGTWETFNNKGIKTAEANYSLDEKNGKWYIWDENGTLRYDMTYFEGDKAGTWYMWDEKGDLIEAKEYELNPHLKNK